MAASRPSRAKAANAAGPQLTPSSASSAIVDAGRHNASTALLWHSQSELSRRLVHPFGRAEEVAEFTICWRVVTLILCSMQSFRNRMAWTFLL